MKKTRSRSTLSITLQAVLLTLVGSMVFGCTKADGQTSASDDAARQADSAAQVQAWLADSVQLLFVGDAMQHESQIKAARQPDGTHDYSTCFTLLEPMIKAADFAAANLEVTLGGSPYTGYPTFSAPDAYARQLQASGFDFLFTANNHSLDRRERGVKRTIATLDEMQMPHCGTYADSAARKAQVPHIATVGSFKVAMLNYTYGTNGIPVKGSEVVNMIDTATIAADIAAARKAGAEVVCVGMHWGEEYTLTPVKSQLRLADFLVRQGVDLIIGGHPHVVEPMHLVHSDQWNKDILLVYSLGNFISGQRTADTRGGALVTVNLKRNERGEPVVANPRYQLFFCQPPVAGGNYTLIPEDQRDKVAAAYRGNFDTFMRRAHSMAMSKNQGVPQIK